jgi:general stress protein 26
MHEEMRKWIKGKWVKMQVQEEFLNKGKEIAERMLSYMIPVVFINMVQGRPQAKAMYVILREGIQKLWFNTDSTAEHLRNIREDPISTVYVYDAQRVEGVMLSGKAYIETDEKIRMQAWGKAVVTEYEGGVNNLDFQVVRFETEDANCFFEGTNVIF